jgi:predicted ATPase/DNA-binding SARP family transcriptional activator
MAHLTLGVLGALQVTLADVEKAEFRSDRTRALLVYLAVEADRPHRREALAGLLWPDYPEETARHNLRQALLNLRQAIGDAVAHPPYLLITRHEIQFNAASDFTLDVASFDAHLAATASHPHARLDACAVCAPRLQQAVDLYRGQFLQEFFLKNSAAFEEWALTRRESFHHRTLETLGVLSTYYEQHGDLSATRRCALRQLELDPWREQAHRQMMRVFALEGQYGAAVAQYETCRRVLAEEMGVEPSRETRELYEEIKSGNWRQHPLEAANLHAERPTPTPRVQLPTYLTPFIGRERELQDLGRLIADPACRLITLIGPGGMGKTRLAVQAASLQRNAFRQGVAFVPLVAIESAEATVPAIADALGFSFYGPTHPRAQLFNYLRDKQLVLVLDNVEQLMVEDPVQGNAADLFVQLLEQTSGIKLLVTSREPLNVQGEWVFQVEGLQIPEADRTEAIESSAAVALFVQRAQRARVGFALNALDRSNVARICRLVDGTPLALELAATWVRTLSVGEIVGEIERNLDFLSTSGRDLPERHRSMRVVFDHSWKMLAPEERRVLRALTVFHGRFQRRAAEEVAGASLATLSALLAKSLVRRTHTGHYDLHELVRQYAASQVGDDSAKVAERHSQYYLSWLAGCMAPLHDRRQKETVAELAAEVENLRAAWDWAVRHLDLERVCQVSPALWYLFELRSWFAEGETLFRDAAETIRARATEIEPDKDARVAVNAMRAHSGYFAFRQGKGLASYAVLLPSATALQSGTDQLAATYALWYLGIVCWYLGKFGEASTNLQASLENARARGEQWYATVAQEFMGIVGHEEGEYDRARRYLKEALATAREIGDPMLISHVLGFLSLTTLALGDVSETEGLLRESLAIAQEIGYRSGIGNALDRLGLVAQMTNPEQGRTLFVASCDVFKETGDLRNLSKVLGHQGYNSLERGDVADAQGSFFEVLRLAREGGYLPFALDALVGLAIVWSKHSSDERALELVNHALQHPATPYDAKSRAERLRTELEARLTRKEILSAQTQAREQSIEQIVNQVLEHLS